jgi:hypothetical protein
MSTRCDSFDAAHAHHMIGVPHGAQAAIRCKDQAPGGLVISITIAAVFGLISSTGAGTATAGPAPSHNCVVVVDKPMTPDGISPEIYSYCSLESMTDALSHLSAAQAAGQLGPRVVDSSDLLMTWFQDVNFQGDSTNIFGGAGPCDTAGYRVAPDSFWASNLTALAGTQQCTHVDLTTQSKTFADDFSLPVGFIGNTLNDNVGLTHVYHL